MAELNISLMNKNLRLHRLILAMTAYDHGDPMRIQHFMKVLGYATTIGTLEGLPADTLDVLQSAAVLHDIGIHISEQKYGSSNGKYQEQEGPAEARRLLATLNEEASAPSLSTPGAPTTAGRSSTPAAPTTVGRSSTPAAPLFSPAEVDRICFLIAHHHTYTHIDAIDYQVLVEADFLVNLYEDYASSSAPAATAGRLSTPAASAVSSFPSVSPKAARAAESVLTKIFRTNTGKALLRSMFLTPR